MIFFVLSVEQSFTINTSKLGQSCFIALFMALFIVASALKQVIPIVIKGFFLFKSLEFTNKEILSYFFKINTLVLIL